MSSRYHFDPAHEILLLTTTDGKVIGKAPREECHKGEGKTHWAVFGIIKRSNSNVILAKRSSKKSVFPNIWDGTVASHVLVNDTPESATKRETKEELGIDVDFKVIGGFYYFHRDGDHAENEFCSLLICRSDAKLSPLASEVSEVTEISFAELQDLIHDSPDIYAPWLKIALEKYGDIIKSF